jgi:hypothetical protein
MVLVGQLEPTLPRPHVDAVVATLVRLIAVSKEAYREPLLAALFVYRRREGLFVDGMKVPLRPRRARPILVNGRGSGESKADEAVPASYGRADRERPRVVSSRKSQRLSL